MRENRPYGSVRGVAGDRYPYRDSACPNEWRAQLALVLSVSRPQSWRVTSTWRGHSCLPAPRLFSARASPARLTHAPHALVRVSVTDSTVRQASILELV